MKTLTLAWLNSKKPCEEGLAAFEALFGESVDVTLENCQKAVDEDLEIGWLVEQLPAPAYKLYDESTAPAYKLYTESIAAAHKLYDESTAAA